MKLYIHIKRSTAEYLPQKSDFHPKRNQARQKLSTLPKNRFRDLASDVYFELERRYPEFNEPEVLDGDESNDNVYDLSSSQQSQNRGGAGYPASSSSQVQLPTRSTSRDDGQNGPRLQSSTSNKRPQFPQGKPSMDYSSQSNAPAPSAATTAAPTTAANEVIIPNKSKVIEEDISLPASTAPSQSSNLPQQRGAYGNYANQNGYSGRKSNDRERPGLNGNNSQDSDRDPPSPSIPEPPRRPSNETPRLGNGNGPLLPTSPDWNNSLARASEASSLGTRLIGGYGNSSTPSEGGLREWESDEIEKLKSDYEYKIATMQNRMTGLEKDLRLAQEGNSKDEQESKSKIEFLEHELDKLNQRNEDSQRQIDQLESELIEAQEQVRSIPSPPPPQTNIVSSEEDKAEISRLKSEVDQYRSKYNSQIDATENLKNEIEGLVDTLKEMNQRQDELVHQREADLERIVALSDEVKDWKGRYETAKTELRDLKGELKAELLADCDALAYTSIYLHLANHTATSQLFVRPTKADDDYMPTSPYGAISDAHVTRFQSSIDDLLISGRYVLSLFDYCLNLGLSIFASQI